MNSYGIFGGTFDPIHKGHVELAKSAIDELELKRVLIMPNFISPFKTDMMITSSNMRYEMIKIAIDGIKGLEVSDYELKLGKPVYTYDTLMHFEHTLHEKPFFLLGFDSLFELETWHRGRDILSNYVLISALRQGFNNDKCLKKVNYYRKEFGTDVRILNTILPEISSTELRSMIKNNEDTSLYLDKDVRKYIRENELYKH